MLGHVLAWVWACVQAWACMYMGIHVVMLGHEHVHVHAWVHVDLCVRVLVFVCACVGVHVYVCKHKLIISLDNTN